MSGAEAPAKDQSLAGIGFVLLAVLIIPGMDAVAKLVSGDLSPGQIAWARFLFLLLFTLPFARAAAGSWRAMIPPRPRLNALRGPIHAVASFFFFGAIATMPLADALALAFVQPLFLTALSPIFLGERIGVRRWTAVGVGFVGALIIARPGGGVFGWTAALPLASALIFSFFLILTRKVAGAAPVMVTHCFAGLTGTLFMTVALAAGAAFEIAPLMPSMPSAGHWLLLALAGLIGMVAHFFLLHGYRRAPASTLAPMHYIEIVAATVLGLAIFGDFPDRWTWVGLAVIVTAGVYVSYRERVVQRRGRAGPIG
jgi:drug/metabolite transporter (DMT)-like permease